MILDFLEDCDYALDYYFDMAAALKTTAAAGLDDIFWKLVVIGMENDYTSTTVLGETPLYIAIHERKEELAKQVIEAGLNIELLQESDDDDDSDSAILKRVIEWGNRSVLKEPLKASTHKFNPSMKDFELALKRGCLDVFLDVMARDSSKFIEWSFDAVSAAVECDDLPLLENLIASGANVDSYVLAHAWPKHPLMVKTLLERYRQTYPQGIPPWAGSSIIPESCKGTELFDWFELLFQYELVTAGWLQSRCEGDNILNLVVKNHIENLESGILDTSTPALLRRLISAGSDVNLVLSQDCATPHTVLSTSIKKRSLEVTRILIEQGADVNTPARLGIQRTPLQSAVEANDTQIVLLLLEKGAEVNAPPAMVYGATALQFAAINGNCEMANILIEHGARLDTAPPIGRHGRWPLERAAEHGRLDMIRLLWEANGGPFPDRQCQRAKRLAERNGFLGCRDYIDELLAKSSFDQAMNRSGNAGS